MLALRFADRLGKGIRSSPRDAMLATFATESNRGQIFGFHRGMDHAGAVMGPLIAAAFLYFRPDDYRTLFALTIVPGIIVVAILLRVPDTRRELSPVPASSSEPRRPGRRHRDERLPRAFWHAMALIFLFSLGNASDAFLLLRFADVGIAPFWIPLLWSAIHVVKTASSDDRRARVRSHGPAAGDWHRLAALCRGLRRVRRHRFGAGAGRRVPGLRAVFRADRRSGEGVGGRPRAGVRARQCVRHLQRVDRLRGPWRQPAVRLHLDARLTPRRVLHRRRLRPRRDRVAILDVFLGRRDRRQGVARGLKTPGPTGCVCGNGLEPRVFAVAAGPAQRRHSTMKKILVTNDDGVWSEGLHELARAVARLGDVVVVAPNVEASAIGHALTLRRPLRVEQREPNVFEVDGTPTDCVNVAITRLLDAPPDLILSGINKGYNLGDDVTYSGTVAGAMEGALLGIPSIAVSLERTRGSYDFRPAAAGAAQVAERILAGSALPARTFLNINVPRGKPKGIRITVQAKPQSHHRRRQAHRSARPGLLLDRGGAERLAAARPVGLPGGARRLHVGHAAADGPDRLQRAGSAG